MRTLQRAATALLAICLSAPPLHGFQVTLDAGAGAVTIVDNDGNDANATAGVIDFSQTVAGILAATGRVQQAFGPIGRSLYTGTNTPGSDATFSNLDSASHAFVVTVESDAFAAPGPPLGWSLSAEGFARDAATADVEVTTNDVALRVDPGNVLVATASASMTPAMIGLL